MSIVVPTVGRLERLRACLTSVGACAPAPDEVVVVDQSGDPRVAALAHEVGARVLSCSGSGVARATNAGLDEARHETVLVTHDDCTVARDWVGAAKRLVDRYPGAVLTGRVLPTGDPRAVPSTIDDPQPREHTGEVACGALYPNNMVLPRSRARALGGFDDRVLSAEDNDFCYRWLRGGWPLRYEPELVVWHHEWRSREELERLYVRYYEGQGRFYAKHLRRRDLNVMRFLARDLLSALRGLAAARVKGRPRWTDPRRGIPAGLARGLIEGWSVFRSEAEASSGSR